MNQFFLGIGTCNQSYGSALNAWPPTYQWNIPRYSLANTTTTAAMHAIFTSTTGNSLLTTHGLFNIGLHGIDSTGDVLPAVWGQFLDELNNCLGAGWCEVVTYKQLAIRNGVTYPQSPSGGQYIQNVDQTGTPQKLVLP